MGGQYTNNYNVPGTASDDGLNRLNSTFPSQGGYAGQIVFHAKTGTVAADSAAVNQATTNIAALPDVIKAVSPFSSPSTGAVAPSGTIAYASVAWDVNPSSLDTSYLNRLNNAVAPARKAGLQVEYGGGAGEIGQKTSDTVSELIGLACALILLLFMFGSLIAAVIPLMSAIFSVGAGLSLLGVLAAAITFPTTAPTIATLLGLGVAIDYGLFLVARHREQLDSGLDVITSARRAEGTSGAAVVVAGSTVVISARVITTAAAIMVTVFLSFVLNSDPTVKMLAVGMAVAVFIDASLVRMILVPAVMALLGRAAWWMPRWMEPIVPHLQLEGSEAAGAAASAGRTATAATPPGRGPDARASQRGGGRLR